MPRQADRPLLLAVMFVHVALTIFLNLAFRPEWPWLNTLTANLIFLLVMVGLLFWRGGLRPADVGLVWGRVPGGVGFTLLVFGVSLLGFWAVDEALAGVRVYGDWGRLEPSRLTLALVAHLVAVAPYEEITFRGFLFVQLYLFFRARLPSSAMLAALLGSQLFFAFSHAPNRIWIGGDVGADLSFGIASLLLSGIVYTLVYLFTGNLFAVIGFHALKNLPPLALESPEGTLWTLTSGVLQTSALLLALIWWWRSRETSLFRRLRLANRAQDTQTQDTQVQDTQAQDTGAGTGGRRS